MKPHKSTSLKTLKGVLFINDLTYEYFAEKHGFKLPTVIGKQKITQTLNNPARALKPAKQRKTKFPPG